MKDMNEVIDALYGVLSYLKNNLIEQARAMLMQKEDLKQFRECLECPKIEVCEVDGGRVPTRRRPVRTST